MRKQKLLSVLLVTIFVFSIVAVAFPVGAAVSTATKLTIIRPNKVVPGGGIELGFDDFSATGGTVYFYFSKNDDPEITDGDIFISDMKKTDLIAELEGSVDNDVGEDGRVTIYAPDTIAADKYYVKVTDLKRVGADAVASASMTDPFKGASRVQVVTEDLPTITVDPTAGTIYPQRKVTVEGSGIASAYWGYSASLYWVHYEVAMQYNKSATLPWAIEDAVKTVVEGAFSFIRKKPIPPGYDERARIPIDAYTIMGARKILVLLYDGSEYLGTFAQFEVQPSLGFELIDFQYGDDDFAGWSTDYAYGGSSMSVELEIVGESVDSYARVAIPKEMALNDLTSLSFWYKLLNTTTGYSVQPYVIFEMDASPLTPDGTADTWVVLTIHPPTQNFTGPKDWTKWDLASPTPGDLWHVESSVAAYQVSVGSPKTLAEVKALTDGTLGKLGTRKILRFKVAIGEGTTWWAETAYVDSITINGVPALDDPMPDMLTWFSIRAEAANQGAYIIPHGFPKGDIDSNTIKFVVKDIRTGEVLESITSDHPKATVNKNGTCAPIACSDVDDAPVGTVSLEFKDFTLTDVFVSSEPGEAGDLKGKMTKTEGFVGDTVSFLAVELPESAYVKVTFEDDVHPTICDGTSDENGGWVKRDVEIPSMPGGKYTGKLFEDTYDRSKSIGTFTVLTAVIFYDTTGVIITSIRVGDKVYISGTGFPLDSKFKTIVIGTGIVRLPEWAEVFTTTFEWDSRYRNATTKQPIVDTVRWDLYFVVPHTSGGGQKVKVEVQGKDAEGAALTIESQITVKPVIWTQAKGYAETLCMYLDPDGEFYGFDDGGSGLIFAGNPMKIEGYGFLAGEAVTIDFIDPETGKSVATAEITDGGKADSDGDVEAVFSVPVIREFKFTKIRDIKVAGTTKDNKYTVKGNSTHPLQIDALDDDAAKLFIGLEPDGDLDFTWSVGSEVRVVGVGFETKELTLCIDTKELKTDIASEYGYFDTTVTVPTKLRDWWVLKEYETGRTTDIFVQSKVVLSPSSAPSGAKVTATGSGFDEEEWVKVFWPGMADYLVKVTTSTKGEFTADFTVPVDTPGTYAILFDAETLPENYTDSPTWDLYTYQEDPEVDFTLLGALRIVSLTMPGTVYNGTSITISVNVQDFAGTPITGAKVTGSITPPVGAAITLTFTETATGIYTASWAVPADAKEGTYRVDAKAEKAVAGGVATASGSFYVEAKLPPVVPPPAVDISKLEAAVAKITGDMTKLAGDVTKLGTDVSGLKSDIAALAARVEAIPIVPVEWIYITAIMAVIAAIAAIAAVVAVYRKIA